MVSKLNYWIISIINCESNNYTNINTKCSIAYQLYTILGHCHLSTSSSSSSSVPQDLGHKSFVCCISFPAKVQKIHDRGISNNAGQPNINLKMSSYDILVEAFRCWPKLHSFGADDSLTDVSAHTKSL